MLNHQFGLDPASPIPSALGRRGPAVIRFFARVFNPGVLAIAGRRWMPTVGILYHQGKAHGARLHDARRDAPRRR